MLCRTRAGAALRDLPAGYGPLKTVYNRHRRWSGDGRDVGVDSTVIRAHQDVVGAAHTLPSDVPTSEWRLPWRTSKAVVPAHPQASRGAESNYRSSLKTDPDPPPEQAKPRQREALGRSRGGFSTKLHIAADSWCRPLGFITTVDTGTAPRLGRLRAHPGSGRSRQDRTGAVKDTPRRGAGPEGLLLQRDPRTPLPTPHQGRHRDQGRPTRRPPAQGLPGRTPAGLRKVRYRDRNTVERAVRKYSQFRPQSGDLRMLSRRPSPTRLPGSAPPGR